ncbi:hypothetical protein [Acetobacter okinawensis]|uniref:hypothetical protein n=1 Tax=Acetobacter okinawensis TaxID=1076594 RepID=UPI000A3D4DDF|nr:hypothetical protein [Acetobacter okinawensis]
MKLKILGVLCMALFALPANAASKSSIRLAEDAVKDMAKDPDSTKFKEIKLSKKCDDSQYVTGFVNAKNSYGAYNGYKIFVVKIINNRAKVLQAYGLSLGTEYETEQAAKCE